MTKRNIIFTTETDGLVKHQVISEKYIHLFPNMLEFSMSVEGSENKISLLIDNGIDIKENVTKINGIDNKLIDDFGVNANGAARLISTLINNGDCLVSHNIDFHLKVLKAFFFRNGLEFPEVSTKCLQKSLIDVVAVPFDEDNLDKGFKKPSIEHLKDFYVINKDTKKLDALYEIFEKTKDILIEERTVKPASF